MNKKASKFERKCSQLILHWMTDCIVQSHFIKNEKNEKKFSILLQHLKKVNNPAEMEKSLKEQKICRYFFNLQILWRLLSKGRNRKEIVYQIMNFMGCNYKYWFITILFEVKIVVEVNNILKILAQPLRARTRRFHNKIIIKEGLWFQFKKLIFNG